MLLGRKHRRLKGGRKVELVSLLPKPSLRIQKVRGSNNTYLPDDTPAPWEEAGIRYVGIGNRDAHKAILGESGPKVASTLWNTKKFYKINLAQVAADFYALEAMSSLSYMNDKFPEPRIKTYANRHQMWEFWNEANELPSVDTIDGIAIRATLMLESLSSIVAPIIDDCLHYSMYGELTYHPATWYLGSGDEALISWYRLIQEVGREQTAAWAYEMFSQKYGEVPSDRFDTETNQYVVEYKPGSAWHSSFGGAKWAEVAKLARYRAAGKVGNLPMDDRQFLDRAFNLQHNTGSALNKVTWGGINTFDNLRRVLDAHGDSEWSVLANHCSPNVKIVEKAYVSHLNMLRADANLPEVKAERWEPIPWTSIKDARQSGVCKTSGKKFPQWSYVYTHDKGASLVSEYNEKCWKFGIDPHSVKKKGN